MDYSDTAVIIPYYNEAVTIGKVTGFVLDSVATVERKQWKLQLYKTHYPNGK
ncbi:unknown [Collinsella sp. CAG:289]|nr:unknown [Collinsella sp. CAG:289]